MPQLPPDGLSKEHRTAEYVLPNRRRPVLWISIAASAAVAAGLFGLYLVGVQRSLSPGPLAAHHGNLDNQCSQCHQTGKAVVDLRCERCHDSGFTDRLLHPSHIALGKGEALDASFLTAPACTSCHRDHQGRQFDMRAVEQGECASCHRSTPSVAAHAEFAVVKAGVAATTGMTFGHKDHLAKYLPEKTAARCEYRHEPTADKRGFLPMDFDRACADCHTTKGILSDPTGFVQPGLLLTSDQLPPFWRSQTSVVPNSNPRGNVQGTNLRHRDGWVIANALRLRQAVDPDGARIERTSLETALVASTERLPLRGGALSSDAALTATIAGVREDIAALDRQIAAPQGTDGTAALQQMVRDIQSLAGQLGGPADAGAIAADAAGLTLAARPPDATGDQASFEWRKTELLSVLASIDARAESAGRPELKQRADALRTAIQNLTFAPGQPADTAGLSARLAELDRVIRLARTVAGQAAPAVDALELERTAIQQQLAGGLPPADFSRVRQQLLVLLDGVDARADDALRARVASVRQRLLALTLTTAAPAALERTRASKGRLLDRLLLEQQLRASAEAGNLPTSQAAARAGSVLRPFTERDRTLLAELRAAAPLPAMSGDTEPAAKLDAIAKILTPCLKCHTFGKPDATEATDADYSKTRLARVLVDAPVMPYAFFDHEPHVTGTKCESCHQAATSSKLSSEVNVPGIANCQQCHNASQVKTTCATCHTYHGTPLLSRAEVARAAR